MKVSTTVDASAHTVWSIVSDLDASAEIIDAIASVERLGGPEFGVGTRWRETRRMFGREHAEEMEVVEIETSRSYTVAAQGGGADYRSTISVDGDDTTSVLTMSFDAKATNPLARVMAVITAPLMNRMMRTSLEADLADIKRAAERG